MVSKPKFYWRIALSSIRVPERWSRGIWIETAGGLDYLRLKEYRWTPVSLTVTILDRLEKLVLLLVIFHLAAYAQSQEECRLRF